MDRNTARQSRAALSTSSSVIRRDRRGTPFVPAPGHDPTPNSTARGKTSETSPKWLSAEQSVERPGSLRVARPSRISPRGALRRLLRPSAVRSSRLGRPQAAAPRVPTHDLLEHRRIGHHPLLHLSCCWVSPLSFGPLVGHLISVAPVAVAAARKGSSLQVGLQRHAWERLREASPTI